MKALPSAPKRQYRINKILHLLSQNRVFTVPQIAESLSVSTMTVRRDLSFLNTENAVRMFHGGVTLNPDSDLKLSWDLDYQLPEQESRMRAEKLRIGQKAASLLKPDDIVIIDAGSTTGSLARAMPEDFKLTVLCFSLNIVAEVQKRKNCRIIMTGGYYHDDTSMFESVEGLQLISKIRATKAFIGASGVSSSLGVTCTDAYQVENKRTALRSSQTKFLLVDSSKFGKVQHAFFADLKDFDAIITDKGIPADYVEILRDAGIQLITV